MVDPDRNTRRVRTGPSRFLGLTRAPQERRDSVTLV